MKRVLVLILAMALLLSANAGAEYIGGDGWFDDNYDGIWQFILPERLSFKTPSDWAEGFSTGGDDEYSMEYMRKDYFITLSVSVHDESMWDLQDKIEGDKLYWRYSQYDESGRLILKGDRDWYIIANSWSMCAFTDGENDHAVEFAFTFEETDYYRTIVRRIISSVQSY